MYIFNDVANESFGSFMKKRKDKAEAERKRADIAERRKISDESLKVFNAKYLPKVLEIGKKINADLQTWLKTAGPVVDEITTSCDNTTSSYYAYGFLYCVNCNLPDMVDEFTRNITIEDAQAAANKLQSKINELITKYGTQVSDIYPSFKLEYTISDTLNIFCIRYNIPVKMGFMEAIESDIANEAFFSKKKSNETPVTTRPADVRKHPAAKAFKAKYDPIVIKAAKPLVVEIEEWYESANDITQGVFGTNVKYILGSMHNEMGIMFGTCVNPTSFGAMREFHRDLSNVEIKAACREIIDKMHEYVNKYQSVFTRIHPNLVLDVIYGDEAVMLYLDYNLEKLIAESTATESYIFEDVAIDFSPAQFHPNKKTVDPGLV